MLTAPESSMIDVGLAIITKNTGIVGLVLSNAVDQWIDLWNMKNCKVEFNIVVSS